MSQYTFPNSDGLQQRIEWLCNFHGIYQPIRLYIMRRLYYVNVGEGCSRALLGRARGEDSIFLFPAALYGTDLSQSLGLDNLPEEVRVKLAKVLAHEFKHALDCRTIWSLLPYHKVSTSTEPVRPRLGLRMIWEKVTLWLHNYCHPAEVRAHWYSFRQWRGFYYLLWNEQYLPMEWFHILEIAEEPGGAAALFNIASGLEARINRQK